MQIKHVREEKMIIFGIFALFCVQKRGKMTIFVYFALFACKKGKRREDDNFSDACTLI